MGDLEAGLPDELRVTFLDVGHGNCTVISGAGGVVLVDAGAGAAVLEFLLSRRITELTAVVISHADQDHVGGLVALLASQEVSIGTVYINSDALKETQSWLNLAYELDEVRREGALEVKIGVVEGDSIPTGLDGVELTAVAPRLRIAQMGAGSVDKNGRRLSTNAMSAVLKLVVDGTTIALLPGDLDWTGFTHLRDADQDLRAEILVAPHHGGLGGTESETASLIEEMCLAVNPKEVLISNGRGRHNNPRPAVVKVIRETVPAARVACTQLSESCLARVSGTPFQPGSTYSAGAERGACCAGTIEFRRGDGIGAPRDTSVHDAFVDQFQTSALCRQ